MNLEGNGGYKHLQISIVASMYRSRLFLERFLAECLMALASNTFSSACWRWDMPSAPPHSGSTT